MADFGKGGGEWNVNVPKGDDIVISWDVLDEDGAAYDWTGVTAVAPIDSSVVTQWSVDTSTNGVLAVALTDTQITALGEQTFAQYLRVTKSGNTSTWLAGNLKVRPPGEPLVQQGQQRTIRVAVANVGTIRLQGCVGGTVNIGGGGGAPTGPASGVLGGTYPSPTFAQDMTTQAELDTAVAALQSQIGTGGPPSGTAGGVLNGTYPNPGFQTPMATAAALTSGLAAKAALVHQHAAADINSGILASARLGTGAANSSTVLYGDNVYRPLSAGSGGSNMSTPKQSNSLATTTTSMTDLPGMAVSLISGHRYFFHFMGKVQSVALTTGARLGFSGPAVTSFIGRVEIDQAQGGVSHLFTNSTTVVTDSIGSLSVDAINVDVAWSFKGVIQPSADGVLQLRGATEVSGSQVTFSPGGMGMIVDADFSGAPVVFQAASTFTGSMTATVSTTATVSMAAQAALVAAATAVNAHPATMTKVAQGVAAVMTATVATPPSQVIWETFDIGVAGTFVTAAKVTADTITNENLNVLAFQSAWSVSGGLSMDVNGYQEEHLNYIRPSHTVHYAKWYGHPIFAGSETAWILYVDRADGVTSAFRVGVTTAHRLIIQDGLTGATDTANFAFVNDDAFNYKFDLTANASGVVKIAIFGPTISNINGTTDGQATDVIQITTTAPTFSNSHLGMNTTFAGGGTTTEANLANENFDTGPNGAQVTQLNTSANSHSGTGTLTFSNVSPAEGAFKLRVNGTASDALTFLHNPHAIHQASTYLDFTTAPAGVLGTAYFLNVKLGDNSAVAFQVGIDVTGHLFGRNAANGTGANAAVFATAFTSGQRYRVEVYASASGSLILSAWTGATLNSTLGGDRWQTITMANALAAPDFGREAVGNISTVTTAMDFSLDRFKTHDSLMPSPIGAGTGTVFRSYFDEFRTSVISMPPNINIGSSNSFSSILVPTNGYLWGGALPSLDGAGTDQVGINQWVTASCDGVNRDYPDILHFYFDPPGRLTAAHIDMLEPAGKNRAIALINWQFLGSGTCQAVSTGAADSNAIGLANNLAAYGNKVMLCLSHEFDNYPNRGNAGNTDANYVAAWRHLVPIIRGIAPNVIFCWIQTGYAGNAGNLAGQWWETIFPGDAYVDWICWDPYFQKIDTVPTLGDLLNNNITNTANGYEGFYWWTTTYHPGKPIMLSEWGTWYETPFDTNAADRQTDASAASRITSIGDLAADYPAMKGFVHFNTHQANDNCIQRPAPNERVLSKAAFKDVSGRPEFTVWQGDDPS